MTKRNGLGKIFVHIDIIILRIVSLFFFSENENDLYYIDYFKEFANWYIEYHILYDLL